MRLIPVVLIFLGAAQPLAAKAPLSQVSAIDDKLMEVAIADEIRKKCDGINARMIRGLARLNDLQDKALSMGYTKQEIDDYVTSKKEKRRMRGKAEAFLTAKGVNYKDRKALCSFGKAEIRRQTGIGTLLR